MEVVKTYDNLSKQEKLQINFESSKDKNTDEKIEEDEENDIMSHLNYRKLQKIKADFVQYDNEGIN